MNVNVSPPYPLTCTLWTDTQQCSSMNTALAVPVYPGDRCWHKGEWHQAAECWQHGQTITGLEGRALSLLGVGTRLQVRVRGGGLLFEALVEHIWMAETARLTIEQLYHLDCFTHEALLQRLPPGLSERVWYIQFIRISTTG